MNQDSVESIASELFNQKCAAFDVGPCEQGDLIYAKYWSGFGNLHDIELMTRETQIGFVSFSKHAKAYTIIGNDIIMPHPGLPQGLGIGLSVHPNFRRRGWGFALLSLGIRTMYEDWKSNGGAETFEIWANPLPMAKSLYKSFGFLPSHECNTWVYDSSEVCEIAIKECNF